MRARSGVSVSDSWKPQQQVLNSLNSCVKVSVRRRTEKGLRTSIQCAKLTLSNTCLVRFPRSTLLSPEQKQEQSDTRHDNTPCETHTVGLTLAPQNYAESSEQLFDVAPIQFDFFLEYTPSSNTPYTVNQKQAQKGSYD